MKVEVLKDIRQAEDEYKSTIAAATESRRTLIASAELEADNLVQNATKQAEEYKKQCIADARSQATETYEQIVRKGKDQAAALESTGKQNVDKVIELLVTRFKGQLNVSS